MTRNMGGHFLGVTMTVAVMTHAGAAAAHHSYVMFDKNKVVSTVAIVRVWQFTNPHATLWVYINGPDGRPKLWALEAPGPNTLLRNGWDVHSVNPGDKVTVTLNPLRSGEHGGSLLSITIANGSTLATGGSPTSLVPPKQ